MGIHITYETEKSGFVSSARTPPLALEKFPLMKEFKSSGQFWNPKNPDRILWGRLHYQPGDGTHLTLYEKIVQGPAPGRHLSFPEIHGKLFNGSACLLKDVTGHLETFIGREEHYRTHLHGQTFLTGMSPQGGEEDLLSQCSVKLSHLDEWFDMPLKIDHQNSEESHVQFEPDHNQVDLEFEGVPFTLEVSCSHSFPFLPDTSGLQFDFSYGLQILPRRPQPLSWFISVIKLTRELFIFLIGSGVYTLEISAWIEREDTKQTVQIYPRTTIPLLVRLDRRYFYSEHSQLRGEFPELVRSWFDKQEDLAVVRHTISDLLTVDGISPEGVFSRIVQTMEHFHGRVFPGKHRYVKKPVWNKFMEWLRGEFPECWEGGTDQDYEVLRKAKNVLMPRIGGVNRHSFRSRIRTLFDRVPDRHLMPILDNPPGPGTTNEYLDELIPRIGATRNYLVHFSSESREKAFSTEELEIPTLQCWSVLIFTLFRLLGLGEEMAGDMALEARRTMFVVGTNAEL